MDKQNIIIKIESGSIAEEMEIEVGDILASINGKIIKDVFDYRYIIQDEYLEVEIIKRNGESWVLEIEKDEYEDLGIIFESGLMDKAKSCSNKCIFCFIDQLPKGMRKTLYFKDDDSRLSFLQGNYVTLTNMKQEDIDRIIFYHLSPMNISVHTTDARLRKFMIKNPHTSNLMPYLKQLFDANIEMNYQIVLCKNINDGEYLDKSIEDLSNFIPAAKTVSVVPLGMTKYREGLEKLELFDKEDCVRIINQVTKWQDKLKKEYGTRFVQLADEFYLKAQMPLPPYENYEGFPQLEDGIGMITLMEYEVNEYISSLKGDKKKRHLSFATGKAAYQFIKDMCNKIKIKFPNTIIDVYQIENDFFGKDITVSGLLTGTDIISQLKNKNLGKHLFIPENCLRSEETVLLDDVDIKDIEQILNVKIKVSSSNGKEFINKILED